MLACFKPGMRHSNFKAVLTSTRMGGEVEEDMRIDVDHSIEDFVYTEIMSNVKRRT